MAIMFDNIPGHVGRLEGLDERRMMLVYQHEYGRLARLRGACSCERWRGFSYPIGGGSARCETSISRDWREHLDKVRRER